MFMMLNKVLNDSAISNMDFYYDITNLYTDSASLHTDTGLEDGRLWTPTLCKDFKKQYCVRLIFQRETAKIPLL